MWKNKKTAITPTREENFSAWYQAVVDWAKLAENSPVRGCMTIKPWGFSIWEMVQKILDKKFKKLGMKMLISHFWFLCLFCQKKLNM